MEPARPPNRGHECWGQQEVKVFCFFFSKKKNLLFLKKKKQKDFIP
jgi:hypothetical protein